MTARQHHFISQCYLRGFTADPKHPQLYVTDLQRHTSFVAAPSKVGLERDFHSVQIPGEPIDVVESKLAEFESELTPVLNQLRTNYGLHNGKDLGILFGFMALLFIKNPRMRSIANTEAARKVDADLRAKAVDASVWEAEMDRAKAEGTMDKDADTDKIRELILSGSFTYGLSTHGSLALEFGSVKSLIDDLSRRKWRLFRSTSTPTAFVTSDNPVLLAWKDPVRQTPAPGFNSKETQIVFPVANNVALVGTFEELGGVFDADDALTAKLNGAVISFAGNQVYARSDAFVYSMGSDPTIKLGKALLDDLDA